VTGLLFDTHGGLWVGSDKGLFHHDGLSFTRYGEAEGLDPGAVLKIVSTAAPVDGGGVDPGRSDGWVQIFAPLEEIEELKLCRFDGGRLSKVARSEGLVGTRLSAMFADQDGSLLVGDKEQAVMRFDPAATAGGLPAFQPVDGTGAVEAIGRSS